MASGSGPLRDFFTRNLGYKLIALLLALILWFDVTSDETATIEYPVPLRIAVEGRDMIVTNDVPHDVEVTFSGPGKELLRLDKDDLSITKEIAGGENDTTPVRLEIQDVRRPNDLNLAPVSIDPGRVMVVTDRFIEKRVSLSPTGRPRTEDGSEVTDLAVEPRSVTLRGVTAEVRPIGSLALDLSQIEDVRGAFDERLEIAVPDTLKTVSVQPDSVRITGRVVPRRPEPAETAGS